MNFYNIFASYEQYESQVVILIKINFPKKRRNQYKLERGLDSTLGSMKIYIITLASSVLCAK